MVATTISRRTQVHTNLLGSHVNVFNPQAQQMLDAARAAFVASGSDFYTATQQAYRAVWGTVLRQSSMVAFVDVFRILSLVFLLVVPLVLLMKRPRSSAPPPDAAAH
jgi:DHA2 family multidrug resistance protein